MIFSPNIIKTQKNLTAKWLKQEGKAIINILKGKNWQKLIMIIPFRIAHLLGYPILKNKKIWLL